MKPFITKTLLYCNTLLLVYKLIQAIQKIGIFYRLQNIVTDLFILGSFYDYDYDYDL